MGGPKPKRSTSKKREFAKANPHRAITGRRRTKDFNPKADWIAPDAMPQWQVDLVKAGKMCGAEKPGGAFCCLRPSPFQDVLGRSKPWRCQWHGGKVPPQAVPPEARRAASQRHGFYSGAVMAGEEDAYDEILKNPASSLDKEIAMLKLRLRRLVEYEARQEEARGEEDVDSRELVRSSVTTEVGPDGVRTRTVREKAHVDHSAKVSRCVADIAKLMAVQAAMSGEDVSSQDRARFAREAMAEARKSVIGS